DFIYQIGGISKAPGNPAGKVHKPAGGHRITPAPPPLGSKSHQAETNFPEDLPPPPSPASPPPPPPTHPPPPPSPQPPRAPPLPPPTMAHSRGGPAAIDPAVYPDIEEFWADLAAAYADEVARLAALGCTYLQLDDTSLAYLNDPAQRAEITERGEDAEHLHLRY